MKPIRTAEQHKTALVEVARLMALDPARDSPDGDQLELLAALVEAYERQVYDLSALETPALNQLEAWEKLMRWRSARPLPVGVFYREISPNCNPEDPRPALIAEWGTAPRGNDDGAMAIGASGATYGQAAVKLAGMLGLE